ncbi:RNA polymerase sigma factor, partial [Planctomycetota bacterium]
MTEKELELIIAAQQGDASAFGRLALSYRKRITGLAFTLTQEQEELDDITQTVFLKAFRALRKLQDPAAFTSWIMAITRRTCID